MFTGITMFWARLRLVLARASRGRVMSSVKDIKHIYVQEHKLYYYYYHFGGK